jgi:dTMP kinase
MEEGKYIVIEGHDGTGKSTQVAMLRNKLRELGISSIEAHEPAGTPIADKIRSILKNGSLERDAITNLLLFSASRHEIWYGRALQAIKMGEWVITARSYYSTLAYQGYGEGLDLNLIITITGLAADARYMKPDLAVILDLDNEGERLTRISNRGKLEDPDTFESKEDIFQTKVRNGYLDIAKSHNNPIVSADQTKEKVFEDIWRLVLPLLPKDVINGRG